MTGIISAIKRLATHDGDGLRTTVFFKGCGLRCVWCHNPETYFKEPQIEFFANKCLHCGVCASVCNNGAIENGFDRSKCISCGKCAAVCPVEARALVGEEWMAAELCEKLLEDKPFFDATGGGVTLSGGECLLQADFAAELASLLKQRGVNVAIDTCGFVKRESIDKVLPYADAFLYDVKAVDPDVHKRCTGSDNALILSNLEYLANKKVKIEVRYPFVPQYNSGEVDKIGELLSRIGVKRIKVLAYHDLARSKYESLGMKDTMPRVDRPSAEDIEAVVQRLDAFGLNAVNGVTNG